MTSLRSFLALLALLWLTVAAGGTAAPPLEVYGRLPAFENARISPSGRRVAIIGVAGEERRLRVTEGGRELLSLPLGDQKVRDLYWAGEEKVLLWVSDTTSLGIGFTSDKAELATMMVVTVGSGENWKVFRGLSGMAGAIRGYYGAVQRDGRWYGYFGHSTLDPDSLLNSRRSTRPHLYEVDLDSRRQRRIGPGPDDSADTRDWAIGADGRIAATLDFRTRSGNWTIRGADRALLARGNSPTGAISLLGLGRTPDTILYSVGDDDAQRRLFEQPLAGGAATELLADAEIGAYLFDNRSFLFVGHVEDGDHPQEHFFDPRLDKAMAAARALFPGVTVGLADSDNDFSRLIVETSGPGDPKSWWLLDVKAGKAERLGRAYAIEPGDIGPMRMLGYKAGDGLDMAGVLTLPPGRPARNLPLIMLPHGGPHSRDYPVFDWWAQAFASRGYAVFQPNFRGSTGLGAPFRRAGWGQWGRKMQSDISDGLTELARQGIVDPKRACIVGGSYGGYAALAGVTLQRGLYRCAVSFAGIGDIPRMLRDDLTESGGDPSLARALRQAVGKDSDLKIVSPVNFADRAEVPILLIHGVDDTVVPFRQSSEMLAALRRAGKPVALVMLTGEDHWLSRSETRLGMLKAAVDFVERHNPADARPE